MHSCSSVFSRPFSLKLQQPIIGNFFTLQRGEFPPPSAESQHPRPQKGWNRPSTLSSSPNHLRIQSKSSRNYLDPSSLTTPDLLHLSSKPSLVGRMKFSFKVMARFRQDLMETIWRFPFCKTCSWGLNHHLVHYVVAKDVVEFVIKPSSNSIQLVYTCTIHVFSSCIHALGIHSYWFRLDPFSSNFGIDVYVSSPYQVGASDCTSIYIFMHQYHPHVFFQNKVFERIISPCGRQWLM